jgi:hypothetical protein
MNTTPEKPIDFAEHMNNIKNRNLSNPKLTTADYPPVFYLVKEHREYAGLLVKNSQLRQYKRKKRCKICNVHGLLRTDKDGCVVPCTLCVDTRQVMLSWIEYSSLFPQLRNQYCFKINKEEDNKDGNGSDTK